LHSQANAKIRNIVLACIFCCKNFALDSPISKSSRNEYTICTLRWNSMRRLYRSTELSRIASCYHLMYALTFSNIHAFLWASGVYTEQHISKASAKAPLRNRTDSVPMIKLTSLAEESSRSQEGTHSTTSFLFIATDACKRACNKVNFDKFVSRKSKIVRGCNFVICSASKKEYS